MSEETNNAPEAQTQPNPLQSEVDTLSAKVRDLQAEAASYRTQRNEAMRMNHARGKIMDAHNIAHEFDSDQLAALKIEEGKVIGDYPYQAITKPSEPAPQPSAPRRMTINDVKNMTAEQIEENWDLVSEVMKSQDKEIPKWH